MIEQNSSPKLPAGWTWTTLGETGEVASGGTPSTKDARNFNGDIPWITPADLSGYKGKFISRGQRNISESGLKDSSAKLLPAGTILFSSRAPIGYVAIASANCTTNQGFKNLVPGSGLFNEYVYYFLKNSKELAESFASGTTFREISGKKFSLLPIPLAPAREQQRIVAKIEELLTKLDAGVEELRTARAQLKRFRQSVLKSAVTGELTREWRGAHHGELEPASELLACVLKERRAKWEADQLRKMKTKGKIEKNHDWRANYREPVACDTSRLPELPKQWLWVTIDQLTEIVTKGSSPNWQGFNYSEEGVKFVRSQNVLWGKLDITEIAYLPLAFNEKEKKSILKADDVLLNIVGASIGRAAVASKDVEGGNVNQAVAVIRLLRAAFNPTLLVRFLISFDTQHRINAEKVDVARANLSLDDIRNLPIPLMSLDEQEQIMTEIERLLSISDSMEQTVDKSLKQAERMRQSIFKKAFEGKLVAQEPNDEPAAVLLERIKQERAKLEAEESAMSRPSRKRSTKKRNKRSQRVAA